MMRNIGDTGKCKTFGITAERLSYGKTLNGWIEPLVHGEMQGDLILNSITVIWCLP